MSLSKNHIKLITSLSQKKYRQKHKLFVVEGVKVVQEFLNSSYELEIVFSTDTDFSSTNKTTKQQKPVLGATKNSLESISKLIKQPIQTEKVVKYFGNNSLEIFLYLTNSQYFNIIEINRINSIHNEYNNGIIFNFSYS